VGGGGGRLYFDLVCVCLQLRVSVGACFRGFFLRVCPSPATPPPAPSHRHRNSDTPRSALARKNGYTLAYNQEIVGLGLANFVGAMFSAYTTTGSFSRSAVNNASGGFWGVLVLVLVLV
jgi:hypothetical protein